MNNNFAKGQELYDKLVQKSFDDNDFKNLLIKDPKTAIEGMTGVNLNIPEGYKIAVEDQSDTSKIYINIPRNTAMDDIELSTEELEAVSGGSSWPCGITIVAGGAQILEWLGDGWNNYKK